MSPPRFNNHSKDRTPRHLAAGPLPSSQLLLWKQQPLPNRALIKHQHRENAMLETIWDEILSNKIMRRTVFALIAGSCLYWAEWSGLAVVSIIFGGIEIFERLIAK
jgi:hypothetical protein